MSQHKIAELQKIDLKTSPGQYKYKGKIVTITGRTSKVEQGQAAMTDINRLLEPAQKRGLLRHVQKFEGQYDDVPYIDYQTAQNTIAQAKSMFEELPPQARQRFHSPGQFLEFVQNPNNANEMQKMGLLGGNDGLTKTNQPSGAPTPTDQNGDGIPDPGAIPPSNP